MEQQPPPSTQPSVTSGELFGGTAVATQPSPTLSGSGAVEVTFARPASNNRFFAVPVLGIIVKEILLIPHFVIVYALAIVVGLLNLVTWIPVLSSGVYPDWGRQMVGGYVRWLARVTSYLFGLTDEYPPFTIGENDNYPVQVTFDVPAQSKKLWAIPVVGYGLKLILLIPHLIALTVLVLLVSVMQIGLWVPVLFGGRYPEVGYSFVGGTIRWITRFYAYFYGLTDNYPAFSLT